MSNMKKTIYIISCLCLISFSSLLVGMPMVFSHVETNQSALIIIMAILLRNKVFLKKEMTHNSSSSISQLG